MYSPTSTSKRMSLQTKLDLFFFLFLLISAMILSFIAVSGSFIKVPNAEIPISKFLVQAIDVTSVSSFCKPNTSLLDAIESYEPPLEGKELYISFAQEICELYDNVEPELVMSVIEHESMYDPSAKNGEHIGLMQNSIKWQSGRAESLGVEDLWDPYGNILTGVDLLSELIEDYADGDIGYALMLYNMNWSTAKSLREQGKLSNYAMSVLGRAEELKEG